MPAEALVSEVASSKIVGDDIAKLRILEIDTARSSSFNRLTKW